MNVRDLVKGLRKQGDRAACEETLLLYTSNKVARRLISFGLCPSPPPLTASVTTFACMSFKEDHEWHILIPPGRCIGLSYIIISLSSTWSYIENSLTVLAFSDWLATL